MFPAARLTGLDWDRLNMHEFLYLANTPNTPVNNRLDGLDRSWSPSDLLMDISYSETQGRARTGGIFCKF